MQYYLDSRMTVLECPHQIHTFFCIRKHGLEGHISVAYIDKG